ncbi:MAG: dienelactone hydrolase family protein [Nitrososphaeraceae archaeon]
MPGELVRLPIKNSSSNSFIEGNLVIPDDPIGIVVFAHGSGSSKNSKRNQLVSEKLNKNNIATLLFDLLSDEEQAFDSQLEKMTSKIPGVVLNKSNVSLLTKRLSTATDWVFSNPHTEKLQLSYFASSTGAAAALMATCLYNIVSIVIRSGRTDLVENQFLDQIVSPCLFVVGSREKSGVKISRETIKKMRNSKEKKLSVIEGASHLFEEEGTMQVVAEIATQWLTRNFTLGANTNSIGK